MKPTRWLVAVLLMAVLLAGARPVAAQSPASIDGTIGDGEYSGSASFSDGRFHLHWRIAGDTLYLAMDAETTGWVSVGIEPEGRMQGADMLFGWVNEDGSTGTADCYATDDWGEHPPDEELGGTDDILAAAGTEANGRTVIELARPLVTGDLYDREVPAEGALRIIWAYGARDGYTGRHTAAGAATIDLGTGAAASTSAPRIWPWHAAATGTGFLCILVGAAIARYAKRQRWWLKTHRALAGAGGTIALLGVAIGWAMVARAGAGHWRGFHAYLGYLLALLLVVTPALGLVQTKLASAKRKAVRAVHRWFGRASLLLMAAQILLGVLMVLGHGGA